MKMHEIIREKRIAKGLTQEQVASCLGVSTPAVNKWEKAVSCPDIALLPALARLLDTDPNTLLSFQEELSTPEIAQFLNQLCADANTQQFDQVFARALDKVHAFPTCERLLLSVALTLEGLLNLSVLETQNPEHQKILEQLYQRAAASETEAIASQAKSMLISKYIARHEFEAAEALIQTLPEENTVSKKQLQINLWMAQENWAEAARVTEQRLLTYTGHVQSALFTLLEIALKEGNPADAEQIAETSKRMVSLFDLWGYSTYVADFQYALLQKDAAKGLEALQHMLPALLHSWKINRSPLYRHQPQGADTLDLGKRLLAKILRDLANPANEEYAFLRNDPECAAWIAAFQANLPESKS